MYYEVLSVPLINQPHDDFYFFRQASLNDAAEKYYKQAASLRPDVSSKPWHFTVSYSTLDSHIYVAAWRVILSDWTSAKLVQLLHVNNFIF